MNTMMVASSNPEETSSSSRENVLGPRVHSELPGWKRFHPGRVFARCLQTANQQARNLHKYSYKKRLFYEVAKKKSLCWFGKPDGFELQTFQCWGPSDMEWQEEEWYPTGGFGDRFGKDNKALPCYSKCSRCGGTGVYSAFILDRYVIYGIVFHIPRKIFPSEIEDLQNDSLCRSVMNNKRIPRLIPSSVISYLDIFCFAFSPIKYLKNSLRCARESMYYKLGYAKRRLASKVRYKLKDWGIILMNGDDDIPF